MCPKINEKIMKKVILEDFIVGETLLLSWQDYAQDSIWNSWKMLMKMIFDFYLNFNSQ